MGTLSTYRRQVFSTVDEYNKPRVPSCIVAYDSEKAADTGSTARQHSYGGISLQRPRDALALSSKEKSDSAHQKSHLAVVPGLCSFSFSQANEKRTMERPPVFSAQRSFEVSAQGYSTNLVSQFRGTLRMTGDVVQDDMEPFSSWHDGWKS